MRVRSACCLDCQPDWADAGEVIGLRVRRGYMVEMKWANGKLVSAEISHWDGGECNIRYNGKVIKTVVPKGKPVLIQN